MTKTMIGFKGFTKDLKCRDFQFEIGKTYEHKGKIDLCSSGFHFCEHPLSVFSYYAPADSRFAQIEAEQVSDQSGGDTKRVAGQITLKAEVSFQAIIEAAVSFVFRGARMDSVLERAKAALGSFSDKADGAASATGYQGAASATGYQGAASATGDQGAASATGDQGAAVALGFEGKAKAAKGGWITLAEWSAKDCGCCGFERKDVKTVRVDGKKIKADTWYLLKRGKFVEVK